MYFCRHIRMDQENASEGQKKTHQNQTHSTNRHHACLSKASSLLLSEVMMQDKLHNSALIFIGTL